MERAVFAVGVVATLLLFGGYAWSFLWPDRRYWPPGGRDWRYWSHWTLDGVARFCLPVLTSLDWGSLGLPRPATLLAGLPLLVGGLAVVVLVEGDLGAEETRGLDGSLATGGFYRYSRHPQYVGFLVATVGLVLVADSRLVLWLGALQLSHWALLPFVEEPWLRDRYGQPYEEYREAVPRFVGLRTLQRLRR